MKRRVVDFRSFDSLRGELRTLRGGGYRRAGRWSLGQNCDHLAKMMDQSIDGFEARMRWWIRAWAWPVKWWLFRARRMPSGVSAPPSFMPADRVEDEAGVERLLGAIDRYVAHAGPLQPSPVLGRLTREEWDQIHLIHASHHLSFIVPTEVTPEANRGVG